MKTLFSALSPCGGRCLLLAATVLLTACSPPADFKLNGIFLLKQEFVVDQEFTRDQLRDLDEVLVGLFGTPDNPHLPSVPDVDLSQLFDPQKLAMAAGPVGSDQQGRPRGLYRQHCAHCHGINGDGAGPTAEFLDPHPRDYRSGVFKFKSTPKGRKPTRDDLQLILTNGIPDTAMPSFRLLPEDEFESVIQYVMYLSIRGEVERNLILELSDMNADERMSDASLDEMVKEVLAGVVSSWLEADSQATEIPPRPTDLSWEDSVAEGRRLFYGEVANCVKCHGESALGDGQTTDYDDWTKEYFNPTEADAKSRLDDYLAAGALPPITIRPRNLRREAFRGGHRPIDVFRRIHNGIDGTPMPEVLKNPPEAKGLTNDQIWRLVDYVRNLRFEALSRPYVLEPNYQRDRL